MRTLKFFMVTAMLTLFSMSAGAQESYDAEAQELGYYPYPYGFVQLQGGLGTTFTDVRFSKLLTPTFSVAGGYMFSPAVGVRIHANGYRSKGGFGALGNYFEGLTADEATGGVWKLVGDPMKYNYSYISGNIDLMVNLFNLFPKTKLRHPLDLYLIGGSGLTYVWDNDEALDMISRYNVGYKKATRSTPNLISFRLGVLADYNLSKHWSLGVEVDVSSLDDSFNSKINDARDWMMTAQVSLTYKFGFKKAAKPNLETVSTTPVYQDTKQSEVASAPTPKPVAEEIKKPKEEIEPVKETIFYAIRESEIGNEDIINKVVAWCKKYPEKTITVNGYADKGTGNPRINATYAKQRAEKVAAALQKKGVPASQMTVNAYGDTIQPFADNDKNRCVIIEGK